jgi:hypothetical protein
MKIEFFSTVAGVATAFPITLARDTLPDWVATARADYLQTNKADQHVYKCPGIFELLTTGYIVHAWHDIQIDTNTGKMTAYAPTTEMEALMGQDPLQVQSSNGTAKHLPKRPWSHNDLIKFNTPWHVLAPKDVKLMMLPIPYTNNFVIEACSGILDPGIASEINIQAYCNVSGNVTVKAGTPLAQLVPLSERTFDLVVRDMNSSDNRWVTIRKYLNAFSYVLNRKKVKEGYNAHVASTKCPVSKFWNR